MRSGKPRPPTVEYRTVAGLYMQRTSGKRDLEGVLAILILLAFVVGALFIVIGTP